MQCVLKVWVLPQLSYLEPATLGEEAALAFMVPSLLGSSSVGKSEALQSSALYAHLMLLSRALRFNTSGDLVSHRHDQPSVRTRVLGSYRFTIRRTALKAQAEIHSSVDVRQRPFIEGDSVASSPDDSEVPVLYTHTLWYAAIPSVITKALYCTRT